MANACALRLLIFHVHWRVAPSQLGKQGGLGIVNGDVHGDHAWRVLSRGQRSAW